MWQVIRKHPRAVLGAIIAHLLFVAILVVSFRFSEAPLAPPGPQQEIIEAEAIDEKVIQAELDRIKAAEQRKQDEARQAREARLQEQRRKEELEEKQRLAEAKQRKEKEAAEKKRLAELEKQRKEKEAAEKKRQEAERKRKDEEARLAKLEAERKAEEREKAFQAEMARQEAELQKQQEAERQAAVRRQAQQSEIAKYESLIKQEITRHWNIPATASEELKCKVRVKLIPGGDVFEVRIIEGSGDLAFDNSVENAIRRAAPLPVPSIESGLFDAFREVDFTFSPRDRV